MGLYRCFVLSTLLLLLSNSIEGDGYKILAVFPFPGKSQYIFAENYLQELARRGHNVTVINTFGGTADVPNFRVIGATKIHEIMASFSSADYNMQANQWEVLSLTTQFLNLLSENIMEEPAVQQLLRSDETFDALIVETVQNEVLFGLAQHFRALTIGISSYGTDRHIDELMGNISPLSYNPMLLSSRTERMRFGERLQNVWEACVLWVHKRLVHLPSQQKLYQKYFPNAKVNLQQAMNNFSLMLLGQHFSLSYPRPYLPNMIEVGGLHLKQQGVGQALPEKIKEFIETAPHGAIYFSMGSNIKSVDLPEATRSVLLETFGSLQERVLWKFEMDEMPNRPANVLISKWFPQHDILAHPNVKLIITHGGLMSTIESVYYGKPVLGLPVFYDQFLNVERAKLAGYGLGLDLWHLNATQLREKIVELLQNPNYTEAAQLRSALHRDQKETPLERAIWWTEYVLRHKGARHMRSVAQDLNFYQLHGLDVWCVLMTGLCLLGLIVWLIIYSLFQVVKRTLVGRKSNLSSKNDPKVKSQFTSKMRFVRYIALLCFCVAFPSSLKGERILAIFPFPGPSQYINVVPYLKGLAARGHEVTSVNAFPQKQPVKNFRDIAVLEVHKNYDDLISDMMEPRNMWQENTFINEFFTNITKAVLENPQVQQQLLHGRAHYDLIIIEALRTDALYGFAQHFNAPIIGLSTFGTDWNIDELVGNTSPLSYTPLVTTGLSDRMTYWERLHNFVETSVAWLNTHLIQLPEQVELYHKYFPRAKAPLLELRKNFSLVLLNQHFSLSFARPYVPNMIEVGGLHIAHKPTPLPEEMEKFIVGAGQAGVIYFSMGSNVKSKDFAPSIRALLLETFASLPQRVLWKFEEQLPAKPDNVFISKWFPQSDILAHPNVKLFITHGGLLSTIESIYHGKPVLGLPCFYDQFLNVERAKLAGFGLGLDFNKMSGAELKSNILRMLNEPSFLETAKQMSARYRDQPMAPLDKAIWWTEYVLRHKGAMHMRVAAQDLSFVAYHNLDVLGLLLGVPLMVVGLLLVVLVKLLGRRRQTTDRRESKPKRQ
ncbi:uncharacterized protein LOC115623986 [Scaptodrosophila lebanonensis]|uniref:Uncharacterized protein LOC115623986 n=1 Tax=Drosophila lebanonensis TaxID=7225 RepID=A0A6J2THB2_DROLE|nr:uncharacterized protein LOC115623986 [Scaptodrosophila lebanonensis]